SPAGCGSHPPRPPRFCSLVSSPWHSRRARPNPLSTKGDLLRIAPHPLIFDWNHDAAGPSRVAMLDDETLRDGLQSPSVRNPSIEEKIGILHHMAALGIDTADIGLPGAGPNVAKDVERLARAIGEARLKIGANCAARTMVGDIKPIAEI